MSTFPTSPPIDPDLLAFMAEIDQELSQASSKTKLRDRETKLLKTVNTTSAPLEARRLAREELLRVQAELDLDRWVILSNVALFQSEHCDSCGSDHTIFLQHMQKQQMVRSPAAFRWVRVPAPISSLPKEVLVQLSLTHFCIDCCEDHGFDLTKQKILGYSSPLVPGVGYEQSELYEEVG